MATTKGMDKMHPSEQSVWRIISTITENFEMQLKEEVDDDDVCVQRFAADVGRYYALRKTPSNVYDTNDTPTEVMAVFKMVSMQSDEDVKSTTWKSMLNTSSKRATAIAFATMYLSSLYTRFACIDGVSGGEARNGGGVSPLTTSESAVRVFMIALRIDLSDAQRLKQYAEHCWDRMMHLFLYRSDETSCTRYMTSARLIGGYVLYQRLITMIMSNCVSDFVQSSHALSRFKAVLVGNEGFHNVDQPSSLEHRERLLQTIFEDVYRESANGQTLLSVYFQTMRSYPTEDAWRVLLFKHFEEIYDDVGCHSIRVYSEPEWCMYMIFVLCTLKGSQLTSEVQTIIRDCIEIAEKYLFVPYELTNRNGTLDEIMGGVMSTMSAIDQKLRPVDALVPSLLPPSMDEIEAMLLESSDLESESGDDLEGHES